MSTIRLLAYWDEGYQSWVAKALGVHVHGAGHNIGAACLDWSAKFARVVEVMGLRSAETLDEEIVPEELARWEAAKPHPGQDMGFADIETRVDVGVARFQQLIGVSTPLAIKDSTVSHSQLNRERMAVDKLVGLSVEERVKIRKSRNLDEEIVPPLVPQHVDASLAIFLSPDGHVLAMRRIEDGRIGLPGGKREPPDPTDKATLVREVAEELGIKLSESMLRLVHRGPGVVPGIVSVFHVESVSFEYGLRSIGRLAQEAGFETVLLNYRRLCESEPYGRWHRSVFPDGFGHLRPTEMR